jgi:hypothetical protein
MCRLWYVCYYLRCIYIIRTKVIILYIEVILLALMCYFKEKLYSTANLYFNDVVVDIITIRRNRNFHLRLFVKGGPLH